MFKRLKETILEIVQQADLILLGLCCAASLFGIAMIYSATRYNAPADNRKIIVQTAALLIGIVVYFGHFHNRSGNAHPSGGSGSRPSMCCLSCC